MKYTIAIVLATLLTGCGMSDIQEELTPIKSAPPAKENVVIVAQTNSLTVYLVTMPDGSRCAVQYRGGIDCDWNQQTSLSSQ